MPESLMSFPTPTVTCGIFYTYIIRKCKAFTPCSSGGGGSSGTCSSSVLFQFQLT